MKRLFFGVFVPCVAYIGILAVLSPRLVGWPPELSPDRLSLSDAPIILKFVIVGGTFLLTLRQLIFAIPKRMRFWHRDAVISSESVAIFSAELEKIRPSKRRLGVIELENLLPHMPGEGKVESAKLFQRIIQDGSDGRYESIDALLASVKERAAGELHQVEDAQQDIVKMGILGTFVGLLFALPQINNVLLAKGDSSSVAVIFGPMFDALKTCMATSVAGLLGSFAIVFPLSSLVACQREALDTIEDAAHAFLRLVRRGAFIEEFEEVKRLLSERDRQMEEQIRLMNRNLKDLQQSQQMFRELSEDFKTLNGTIFHEVRLARDSFDEVRLGAAVKESITPSLIGVGNAISESLSGVKWDLNSAKEVLGLAENALRSQVESVAAQSAQVEALAQEMRSRFEERTGTEGSGPIVAEFKEFNESLRSLSADLASYRDLMVKQSAIEPDDGPRNGHGSGDPAEELRKQLSAGVAWKLDAINSNLELLREELESRWQGTMMQAIAKACGEIESRCRASWERLRVVFGK